MTLELTHITHQNSFDTGLVDKVSKKPSVFLKTKVLTDCALGNAAQKYITLCTDRALSAYRRMTQ